MRTPILFLSVVVCWSTLVFGQEPNAIQLFPNSIELSFQGSRQQVAVQWATEKGVLGALSSPARIRVDDPNIAKIESIEPGLLLISPLRSGSTRLFVEAELPNGQLVTTSAPIHARDIESAPNIEFNNHIQSVLSRNGCNMGACHGALAGKGGFRLSLRAYDPSTDHFNITRQDKGRRIELLAPELSLLVAKPSGTIAHQGGLRLAKDSGDYELLVRWIRLGAAGPKETDPTLDRIEILPPSIRLSKGDEQRLLVRAHYSNGRIDDVTRWAKFSSTDESVAVVDEAGRAKVIGPGEGAVNAWFSSRIVTARLCVPFSNSNEKDRMPMPLANLIDGHVNEQLRKLGLEASNRCSDSEFIRRTSLDAIGVLPTEQQVLDFLADETPDKRSRWIDALLESPEYVDYWAYRWSDLLMLNSNLLRSNGVKAYYEWIHGRVQENTPWDQFVREILTARGEALENGATNFYAINQDPESMTENACQAFMGLSIGCAKCHNHPLEKWTNDQYYAMANLFARVRAKGWGGEVRDGDASRTVMVLDRGELIQPLRGKPQPPAPLDAPALSFDSTEDRREYLAQWLTSPENPYFTRAIVNRVWAGYFGIGIVNPVDDLRASNPASNPALMDALCEYLIEHRYDLKQLMRLILNSETYQRSSQATVNNQNDRKYFSHYYARRLMAEVIHDAIVSVSNVPTVFDKVSFLGGDKRDTKFYRQGTRAIQLFDSSVDSNFLKTFGRNQRRITCECERSDEPSIVQVLNLNNGDTLNAKLSAPGSVVDQLLREHPTDHAKLMEAAYLRCLARYPTPAERELLARELSKADESQRRVAIEDLLWSLMTSREFLFNH